MISLQKNLKPSPISQPEAEDGLIPTLNGYGYMLETPDALSREFIAHQPKLSGPVMDIGCAYGNVALETLRQGKQVYAVDLFGDHLDIAAEKVHPLQKKDITLIQGKFPYIDLLKNDFFSTILASGTLHYLQPKELKEAFQKVHKLLKSGGHFFFATSTPHIKIFKDFHPIYMKNVAEEKEFPGHLVSPAQYAPHRKHNLPKSLILMDMDEVKSLLIESGFHIEKIDYMNMSSCHDDFQNSGKEYVQAIVVKL